VDQISFDGANFSKILLDTVGALIVVLDEKARIVGFNRACEQLTGYSFDEVRGGTVERFLTSDESSGVNEVIRHLLDGETSVRYQNNWITRRGESRWIEWSNSILRSEEDGRVHYILATGIDVTERNLKEKELRESEKRFFSLFYSSPSPISIHASGDCSILEVNLKFEQMVGYTRQELIGNRLDDMGVIRPGLATTGLIDRARVFGKSVTSEFILHTKSGADLFVVCSLVRVNLSGKDCMIATLQDISDRKAYEHQILQMNEELEQNALERAAALEQQMQQGKILQEKLNQLLRVSTVVILSFLPQAPFLITFVSENVETVFGYPPGQLVNIQGAWENLLHPDDLISRAEVQEQILAGNLKTVEFRVRKSDGQYVWVQLAFTLIFDAQGKPVEVQGSLQDITKRREYEKEIRDREELYRSLAESAHEYIYVISREGIVDYVNSYGAAAFGLKPEDMIGKTRDDFFPFAQSNGQLSSLYKVFENNQVTYIENPIPFPKGAVWLGTRLVPIHDQEGRVSAVLGVSRDITEKIRAEQDLQFALQKERELYELQGNFVSMITHQVGTPLSAILSSAEMLEHYGDHWSTEHRQKHLDRIIESTKRVDSMVRDILELGRADANPLVSEPSAVDLVDVCQNVVDIFQQADHGKHQIHFLAPIHPIICWMDEHLIQQILENLMSNAIKYSPERTEAELSLKLEEQQVVIKVRDQGVGISKTDLKRVGTPFFRGKNVSRISGTGLGLTLVNRTIKLLGGVMKITSDENVGTLVELQFPFRAPLSSFDNM
jgi:PAS domain S-box-containing protein